MDRSERNYPKGIGTRKHSPKIDSMLPFAQMENVQQNMANNTPVIEQEFFF